MTGLPPFLAQAVPGWLAARRFGVPAPMVDSATERRLAGDWRGACAAARFDVGIDLADVRDRYGVEVHDGLHTDLRHLAPDLVRWHLPRETGGGTGRVLADLPIVLARYGPAALWVHTQAHLERPQRPRLRFGPLAPGRREDRAWYDMAWSDDDAVAGESWEDARYLWDSRRTDGLRGRLGGDDRTAFHHRDGRRRTADELPAEHPGHDDRAALVEWTTLLLDAGRYREAWVAAGITADLLVREGESGYEAHRLQAERNASVVALAAEVRNRTGVFALPPVRSWVEAVFVSRMAAIVTQGRDFPNAVRVPRVTWQRFPDLELLRLGRLQPRELHPLVRTALFPDSADTGYRPAAGVAPTGSVRVRCRRTWHRVGWRDGRVDALDHDPAEAARERTMRALGGAVSRCHTVVEAWSGAHPFDATGDSALPRPLRTLRRDAVAAIVHGDTGTIDTLLRQGLDPAGLRNRRHRTPLHLVAHIDPDGTLVRKLVDAGLAIEAVDSFGRTPLGCALFDGAPAPLVRALLDTGADPLHRDNQGCTPLHLMRSPDAATILPWLLDAGADLEARDEQGQTPLMVQAGSLAPPQVLRVMLDAGADPYVETDLIEDTIGDKLRRYRYDDVGFVPRRADAEPEEEAADG